MDNRAGASGVVGSVAVARAAPDGYTIGQVSASTHAASSALTRTCYDAFKDFAPISLIGILPCSSSPPIRGCRWRRSPNSWHSPKSSPRR